MDDENKKKEDELLHHNYDGIEEYDNDLPKWWQWLFWLGIVYGFVYVAYYHVGPGLSQEETLVLDLEKIEKDRKKSAEKALLEEAEKPIDLALLVKDSKLITKGKEVYQGKCAACHGISGGGVIGPNLTDDFWIHGGDLNSIKKTIENGVLEKGMLAWKGVIKDEEINAVVAFIDSIHASNPENPKAAQGELFKK